MTRRPIACTDIFYNFNFSRLNPYPFIIIHLPDQWILIYGTVHFLRVDGRSDRDINNMKYHIIIYFTFLVKSTSVWHWNIYFNNMIIFCIIMSTRVQRIWLSHLPDIFVTSASDCASLLQHSWGKLISCVISIMWKKHEVWTQKRKIVLYTSNTQTSQYQNSFRFLSNSFIISTF